MVSLEFESKEGVEEVREVVFNAIEKAINKSKRYAEFKHDKKQYKIDTNSDTFKIGILYGLELANNYE
jgi:hypothetical protein